jgi:DNA-binding NarL/FixJ family response regulator
MSRPPPAIRIVIADDQVLFCEGLRRLLDAEADFSVVATCGDGAEATRHVLDLRPDVLLLDLAMPHTGGLEALQALAERGGDVRTIVLTADIDSDEMLRAIQLGARGVLLKDAAPQLLFKCVRAVMQGDYWVGREQFAGIARRLHTLEQQDQAPPASTLSDRELAIVAAVLEGASNKDIGAQFSISVQTVKNHLSHIFDKLGVSSRLELALYAGHHHLLDGRARGANKRQ